jgi:diguanylate cyclase (GGDEF)-like protein
VLGQVFFSLINPILAFLVAAAFALTWRRWPHYPHLPALSIAFVCAGLAFILNDFQIFSWPGEVNVPANGLYVLAITLGCVSTLLREDRPVPTLLFSAIILAGTLPYFWYLLIEPSTPARVIVVSCVYAATTGITFLRLVLAPSRGVADRLFAAAVALAFVFAVVRPVLMLVGILATDGPDGFGSSDYWVSVQAFTPLLMVGVATLFALGIMLDVIAHLQGQANRDYLTGLFNRRGFETLGSEILAQDQAASGQPAMVVADIDDFKKVNDTFGHRVGDEVIAAVGRVLSIHGGSRLAGRIGGEEFALYYSDTTRAELTARADELREQLTRIRVPGLPENYLITLSIGLHVTYSKETLVDMIARADEALYKAKREGKDRAVITPIQLHLAVGGSR